MSAYNLESKLQTQEIYLDSQYATINNTGGKNSNIYFFFTAPITIPSNYDAVLRVDNFVCPISFFICNINNQTLIIDATTYTIPEGNYNALTLLTALQTLLTASGFTISYNATVNKYTFVKGSSFTFQATSTCLKLLGFTEATAHSSVGNILTSNFVVNLAGTSLIYIDIPNITTQNISSNLGGTYTSIVKSIVENLPYGSILTYTNNTNSATKIRERYIGYLQIRLLDDDYRELDLNGQNFTLTLEIFYYNNGNPVTVGDNLIDAVREQEAMKSQLLLQQK